MEYKYAGKDADFFYMLSVKRVAEAMKAKGWY